MIALLLLALAAPPAHRVHAAAAAHAYGHEPALLEALAYVESRHTPGAVSRVRGRSFCGVLQVRARSSEHCVALAVTALAYLEGARILRQWIAAAGTLEEGLAAYGCGYAARARCRGFAARVIAVRDRIRQEASA